MGELEGVAQSWHENGQLQTQVNHKMASKKV